MPYADPEKQKKAKREWARKYRAEAKAKKGRIKFVEELSAYAQTIEVKLKDSWKTAIRLNDALNKSDSDFFEVVEEELKISKNRLAKLTEASERVRRKLNEVYIETNTQSPELVLEYQSIGPRLEAEQATSLLLKVMQKLGKSSRKKAEVMVSEKL